MNCSSSTSPKTVEAYQYASTPVSISGGSCRESSTYIFVPTHKVEISKSGSASRSATIGTSDKANPAVTRLFKKLKSNGRPLDREEFEAGRQKIEQEAAEKVQVPAELVEQIDALLVERKALEDRQKDINKAIKAITKELFAKKI